jgi:hypothetical protein
MASEKTVTYTAEQTSALVSGYKAGETVEALASTLGKSVRSVVAKLSREGVYKAKSKAKGVERVTKAMLVASIAASTGATEESLESLEKATHEALELVAKALAAE